MNIRVSRNELLKGIKVAIKGVNSKTTLPILKGIKVEAKSDYLELIGTDLELTIETKIPCEVIEEGACVLNAKMFNEIIMRLPEGDICMKVNDGRALITTEGSRFDISTEMVINFPTPPALDKGMEVTISTDALQEGIKKVVVATADDDISRPILTGSKMEIEDNTLVLVAVDGYRLAYKKANVDFKGKVHAVIPKAAMNEIARLIEDVETVKVTLGERMAAFQIGDTRVSTRLLDGEFVNYKQIIRDSYRTKVKVNTKQLREGVQRATLLSKDDNKLVKLDIRNDKIIITAQSDMGNAIERIDILEQEGDWLEIGFNSKFLLDGINSISTTELNMYFENPVTPTIIKEVENEDAYLYLVLPVRLKATA
jgi:DNA polymerase-3 subunit beta